MNMYALLNRGSNLSKQQVEDNFSSNLCRCTGYRSILDAMKSFAVSENEKSERNDVEDIEELTEGCSKKCLNQCRNRNILSLTYEDGAKWYWPQNLKTVFEILAGIPQDQLYMLVGGNTEHGIYRRSPYILHFVDMNGVQDLKQHEWNPNLLTLGAGLTIFQMELVLDQISQQPGFGYCEELREHLGKVANVSVRNVSINPN